MTNKRAVLLHQATIPQTGGRTIENFHYIMEMGLRAMSDVVEDDDTGDEFVVFNRQVFENLIAGFTYFKNHCITYNITVDETIE